MSTPCVGIDLGTTFSCCAIFRNERVDVIPNEQGHRITPSYVAFSPARLVGDAVKNQAASNPENTAYNVKRLIGRKFDDATVSEMRELSSFKVVKGKSSKPVVRLNKKDFSPEELSGMILGKMKEFQAGRQAEQEGFQPGGAER